MATLYPWKQPYEVAVFETDRSKLEERMEAAKFAIHARIEELSEDPQVTEEERVAINDALAGLKILQRKVEKNASRSRR